jgi:hypothetical protein
LKKPPEGKLEFKVIEGWAITHGDILLGKPKREDNRPVRSGDRGFFKPPKVRTWPNLPVPFAFAQDFPFEQRVIEALEILSNETVVTFSFFKGEKDAIVFDRSDSLCASALGRIGGHQPILISGECQVYNIVHEVMHALGFIHEQARFDRDSYVSINWDNIAEENWLQFHKIPGAVFNHFNGNPLPFDHESVMLYGPFDFAIDPRQKAMESLSGKPLIKNREYLSRIDVERINTVYGR